MPDTQTVPVRPRLTRHEWILIVPAAVVVLALLIGILGTLTSVRNQIVQQNQRTRLLIQKADPTLKRAPSALDQAGPLLQDAAPVLAASRKAIPAARRAARDGQALLTASKPVVDDLAPVVADLGPILRQLGPAVGDLRPVLRALAATDLPGLLGSVQRLATTGDRTLPVIADLAQEVQQRELLRRASRTLPIVGRIAELQRAAVQTNRQTLTRTTNIEKMFAESLAIQRDILEHTTSIDRRLGGAVAP